MWLVVARQVLNGTLGRLGSRAGCAYDRAVLSSMRKEPRFVSAERIEMRVSGREEMKALWTENVSRGGLFVVTEDAPPLRTRVEVEIEAPEGKLLLEAEVVHVLDAATAGPSGMPAGVGLQFTALTDKQSRAVDRYVEGVASKLKAETDDLPFTSSGSELIATVMTIFGGIESNDLYEALGLADSVTDDEIEERLVDFKERLEGSTKALTPAQRIRVDNARKMLARIRRVLGNPGRRIEYDLRTQRKKIDTILATKDGLEVRKMREQWIQAFPERMDRARHKATEAVQYWEDKQHARAIASAEEAQALDPLNRDLRSAISDWKRDVKKGIASSG